MNNKKITSFFLFAIVFLFAVNCQTYAFTAIRPDPAEYKPLTPAERRAEESAMKGKTQQSDDENSGRSGGAYQGGSSGNQGGSYNPGGSAVQVESTKPAPKPTPTPTPTPTPAASKISGKVVVFSFVFLLIFATVGWYFTRNINFKKLFK